MAILLLILLLVLVILKIFALGYDLSDLVWFVVIAFDAIWLASQYNRRKRG